MKDVRRLVTEARNSLAVFTANKEFLKRVLTPFEYRTLCNIHNAQNGGTHA